MATTTNYGWTTPDDTALVKDGASAIRTLGSSVDTTTKNLNPETTLGDLSFRSSTSNVKTRLGIGSTGNVLTVASGVPTWAAPAVSASGLTLIAEQTYTAAQTINVNNVFSTTYDNYKIINRASCSGGGSFSMKMRVGGTDTSANYYTQLVYGSGGTATGQPNPLGTDEWFFGDAEDSGMTSMDIMSPFLTAETEAVALAGYRTTGLTGFVRMIAMALDDATSYTGFSLLIGSNATGKVSIYGYAK